MKWFKHYSNSTESNILSEIIEKMGNEGYGLYWRLFEILASNYDGESTFFTFRTSIIKRKIGLRTTNKLTIIASLCTNKDHITITLNENEITIDAPILAKLKDRDFTRSRSPRAKPALEKNRVEKNRIDKSRSNPAACATAAPVIGFLNEQLGTKYKASSQKTVKLIAARLNEGFTQEDFIQVIKNKCAAWSGDPKMQPFLRPETLFSSKFESYLNEKPVLSKQDQVRKAIDEAY